MPEQSKFFGDEGEGVLVSLGPEGEPIRFVIRAKDDKALEAVLVALKPFMAKGVAVTKAGRLEGGEPVLSLTAADPLVVTQVRRAVGESGVVKTAPSAPRS